MIDFYMKCNTGLKWVEFENKNPIYGKSKVNPRSFLKNGFFLIPEGYQEKVSHGFEELGVIF